MLICQSDSRFAHGYPICAKKRQAGPASLAKSNQFATKMVQGEGRRYARIRDLDEAIEAVIRVYGPYAVNQRSVRVD